MLKLYDFSIEYVKNPTLIPVTGLRFGWKLDSDLTEVLQSAYQIVVKDGQEIVKDTGKVESCEVCDITVPELVLNSCTDYMVEVTVWDNHGECTALKHTVSTEILEEEWEDARWIKPCRRIPGWAPYLRTKFVTSKVRKAVMYASGLGCAEYYINGKRTDDYYVDPPQSNYEKIVYYRRFDVTDLIQEGGNVLAVLLGEGFYAQDRVWGIDGYYYGDECTKIKLMLYLEDGSIQEIVTNTMDWKYQYSPITVNNIYGGETYDSRLEIPDFAEYESDDCGWMNVVEDETPKGKMLPALMPPVRIIRELPAVSHHGATGNADGAWIYDIGENIAGTVEYHLPPSPKGAVYVFRYSENLSESGNLDLRSTGAFATQCIQQDMYICRGDKEGEIYRPHLCYHGFRYVEVTGIHDFSQGYGTTPQLSIVKGLQLSTDMAKMGEFSTSHTYLDKMYKLMENTYRSNFHGLPEDCPAREKCGWLGDAQIVCDFGLLTYDSVSSYEKYLYDIRTTREVFGNWMMIAPGKRDCGEATPLWGCAQILIPYCLYKYCGDKEAVTRNADLMKAWVEHEMNRAEDYIISEGLGDWCPPVGNGGKRRIPVTHSSSMMFYEICIRMAELCEELSIGEKAYYLELAEKIKESVNRHFYDKTKHSYGYWGSDGVALMLGIYPEGEKEALTRALVEMIRKDDHALPTGIYSNKYLFPVLLEAGYGEDILKALFHEEHTSFGTMILDGATSVWEGPDMHNVEKNLTNTGSYNHPMHGGFLYACYTHLAGICPLTPGYRTFTFKPCFTDVTKEVNAKMESPYGTIAVSIRETKEGHHCSLSVPAGSTCVLGIDGAVINGKSCAKGEELGSGMYEIVVNE